MKKYLILSIIFGLSFSISYSQIFGKKRNKTNSPNEAKWEEANNNPISSRVQYVLKTMSTNDTVRITQVLDVSKFDVNMPISAGGEATFLQYALKNCSALVVEYLLNKGANPNLRVYYFHQYYNFSPDGERVYTEYPLQYALGDTTKMNLLIKYGALYDNLKVQIENSAKGSSPEYSTYVRKLFGGSFTKDALFFVPELSPTIINEYVKNGADVNYTQDDGFTILLKSCQENFSVDVVNALLKNGANPKKGIPQSSYYGAHYPILYAVLNNNFPVVKLLVEYGADVNVAGEGKCKGLSESFYSIFQYANCNNYNEIADYLFQKGAK